MTKLFISILNFVKIACLSLVVIYQSHTNTTVSHNFYVSLQTCMCTHAHSCEADILVLMVRIKIFSITNEKLEAAWSLMSNCCSWKLETISHHPVCLTKVVGVYIFFN